VEQPVKDVDLFYGAIEGLVGGLKDPYSVYFPPTEAQEFVKDLAGAFEGIGTEIGIKDEQLIVIAPLSGSPAEKAGLKPGDQIYKINGEEAFGLKVDEAVQKIRGPKGTTVKLTIGREGEDKVLDITIVRDVITVPTVVGEKKDSQIAYLRVSYFNGETWDQFDKAVKEIKEYGPKGIILDLRSDPGGYLDTAVLVASEWIKDGDIVKEKFNNGEENKYPTVGKHRLAGIKTVVLVDENSASASEIVAGALQDHGLATVLGVKTYGKGSVQDFEVLPDGSALKLTVARWFTPKDRQIEKLGITPDIEMKEMFVKQKDGTYKDVGLEKAIELLK
jgi:carboxyl-terminal processing protease